MRAGRTSRPQQPAHGAPGAVGAALDARWRQAALDNGVCSYTLARELQLTVTAASTFSVRFKETETQRSAQCTPATDCITSFDMIWRR